MGKDSCTARPDWVCSTDSVPPLLIKAARKDYAFCDDDTGGADEGTYLIL